MKFNFITLSGSLVIYLNKNIKLKSRYMTKWTRIKKQISQNPIADSKQMPDGGLKLIRLRVNVMTPSLSLIKPIDVRKSLRRRIGHLQGKSS